MRFFSASKSLILLNVQSFERRWQTKSLESLIFKEKVKEEVVFILPFLG